MHACMRTHTYAQVPAGPNPSLLIELQQPPGSGDAWDPILVVVPAATQILNDWVNAPLPGLQVGAGVCLWGGVSWREVGTRRRSLNAHVHVH